MKTIHHPTWLPKKGDNNMHINIFLKSLFEQKSIQMGQHQSRSGGSALPIRARGKKAFYGEEVEAKQGNYLIGSSLTSCIIWESLVS